MQLIVKNERFKQKYEEMVTWYFYRFYEAGLREIKIYIHENLTKYFFF